MVQFTLRDLTWLMVTLAVGLTLGTGWWRSHQNSMKANLEVDAIRRFNHKGVVPGEPFLIFRPFKAEIRETDRGQSILIEREN